MILIFRSDFKVGIVGMSVDFFPAYDENGNPPCKSKITRKFMLFNKESSTINKILMIMSLWYKMIIFILFLYIFNIFSQNNIN